MLDLVKTIRRQSMAMLTPPPRLALSEWIEGHLHLPEDVSSMPGRVRLWPYQHGIADAIGNPEVERVTVVKPVRVGFTSLLTGALASFVANDPSPVLVLLPTAADCRDYMVSDIEPIFAATPTVTSLLAADMGDEDRNTLLSRRFPGGTLKIVAAKAPRNLRRHNVRILMIDEADAMETGAEGSPIKLAERRTLSFSNRKIILGSTPILEETSHVLRAYADSDQRVFEVPCASCGAFHEINWQHIEWEEGRPETAAYRCPSCQDLIEERYKPGMVEQGRWRAMRPEVKGHAGFRLNALVSGLSNASWGKLAAEFVVAKDDPAQLQTFVNTLLAQGWRETTDDLDETALQSRCEPFDLNRIPPEVLALTAGVDVQDDRLEITVAGWGREQDMLILGHQIIWGSPDDDGTWRQLEDLLQQRFKHPHGGSLKIDAAAVDSGDGDWTDRVYGYCFPRLARRVMAIKGVHGSRPVLQMSQGKVKGGRLFLVGVDGVKTLLMSRLARGQSIRFSESLEPVWFEQLASERKVLRYSRGQPVRRFERKPGARAEALDCVVYAYAARQGVAINFDSREDEVRGHLAVSAAPAKLRSRWMNG